ncbi:MULTISPECIES: hypothetical protein [unclassified Streptomyces]|uniref:hypothetical protein n=1 Tax=unclassified Streptomyces TaxID=2593676 RepID=UPI002254A5EB|nr:MULTISPECIES: hypothetical protein [unclassified Streptomyces]MCX4882818.1 hypothetical protein [Streptomyces sp. NBC_00847]MCX5422860.1 hypothetical protein [Streptomyces sp. NBC_00078]
MAGYQFELRPFFGKQRHGRQGPVGAFGEVTVEAKRKKPSVKAGSRQLEVRLYGEQMPDVHYQTVGPGRPTLRNARLTVGGNSVGLTFNSKGFRNASRALRLVYQERSYEYVAAKLERGGTLARSGVVVSITRGKNTAGKGTSSFGVVTGEADAVDLALAILFEEVDTLELTTSGAVSSAVNRLLNPRSNEPSAE